MEDFPPIMYIFPLYFGTICSSFTGPVLYFDPTEVEKIKSVLSLGNPNLWWLRSQESAPGVREEITIRYTKLRRPATNIELTWTLYVNDTVAVKNVEDFESKVFWKRLEPLTINLLEL